MTPKPEPQDMLKSANKIMRGLYRVPDGSLKLHADFHARAQTWIEDYARLAQTDLEALTLPASQGGVEGWVLVPKEPTQEMLAAGIAPSVEYGVAPPSMVWAAMVEAAPWVFTAEQSTVFVNAIADPPEPNDALRRALSAVPPLPEGNQDLSVSQDQGQGPCADAQVAPSQWRPIETAPRDGTPILLAHAQAVFDGWWRHGEWVDGCTSSNDGDDDLVCYEPTHWQPLPPPPDFQPPARSETGDEA